MKLVRNAFFAFAAQAAAAFAVLGGAGQAHALSLTVPSEPGVAKTWSFGGSCQHCELSGRKLIGASFTGANFDHAALLDGIEAQGSYFTRADLTKAQLIDALMTGAKLIGSVMIKA